MQTAGAVATFELVGEPDVGCFGLAVRFPGLVGLFLEVVVVEEDGARAVAYGAEGDYARGAVWRTGGEKGVLEE